jgi:uncharacterized protein YdaU (DUF1376 family)
MKKVRERALMARRKAPAFQFYPKDFLVDTAHMSAEEAGAYWRLCSYAWVGVPGCEPGALPLDPDKLARWAGVTRERWDAIADAVLEPWRCYGGVIQHKRLLEELEKQQERRQKYSEAGEKRWGDLEHGPANGDASSPANGDASETPMAIDSSASAFASASTPTTSTSRSRSRDPKPLGPGPDEPDDEDPLLRQTLDRAIARAPKAPEQEDRGSTNGTGKGPVYTWPDEPERFQKVARAVRIVVPEAKQGEYLRAAATVPRGYRNRVYTSASDTLERERDGSLDPNVARKDLIEAVRAARPHDSPAGGGSP